MSTQRDLHILSHAKNPVIFGGTFTNVTNQTNSKVNGFQILLQNISEGAFHNAAERGDPPRCHPRTRIAIRTEIMEWIQAPRAMRKLILWMYGPAGSGKTAIAQSIAEECERAGLLVASFFFWRSAAGRNNADKFVATLVYQISRYIPQIENHLITAIERDPTIFTRSLATQMRALVIEPLKHAEPSTMPIAAIVDGVDECGPDGQAQSNLLHQLGSIASELQHLPLVFLISSRPEYEIREVFNGNYLSSLTKVLVLDNSYKPDEDIKLYFGSTFREIFDKNLRLGCRLPSGWPPASSVNFLVSKASGQFIFASTVARFVDSPRHNPVDRLNTILHLSNVGNETPFAPLDALYRFILGSVADVEKVLAVLTMLLLSSNGFISVFDINHAEELLGFDIRRASVDMHALLFIPPLANNSLPKIYHASLSDFLMDRSRSLEYYIDTCCAHTFLAQRWLKVLEFHHRAQTRISTRDAADFFVYHCNQSHSSVNQYLLDDLSRFDLRAVLHLNSCLNQGIYGTNWKAFLESVNTQGGDREDIFPRLQSEFDAFVLDCIGQYPQPLQPYIPILLLEMGRKHMFDILLYGVCKSAQESNKICILDEILLKLKSYLVGREEEVAGYIQCLVQDPMRAGNYWVHPGSYVALFKAIVDVICAQPGEKNYEITFEKSIQWYLDDGPDPTIPINLKDRNLGWFGSVLQKTPIDMDLANVLLERAVQFKGNIETMVGRSIIAKASVIYIQRCGIPFLKHKHPPYVDECAICSMCEGAVVVEDIPSISMKLPPLPPVSELSDAVVESILALADEFDVTSYPFKHILQFSPSSNGTLFVSFVGEDSPFTYLM